MSHGAKLHQTPEELEELAGELCLPYLTDLDEERIDYDILAKTPFQFARDNFILPLRREGNAVLVVTSRPTAVQPLGDLRLIYATPIKVCVAPVDLLVEAINTAYDLSSHTASEVVDDITEENSDLNALVHGLPEDLLETSAEAPVIRLVNSILMQSAKEKASDIHIEPYERSLAVRFRVDGVLRNVINPPKKLQPLLVSRIKIMAGLNIAEKRLPQDGRLKIVIAGKEIDIRISVIPTAHGERVVMRLLDKSAMALGFSQIGMDDHLRSEVEKLIAVPHGVILVSGPTGSGKTTTLYTALSAINSPGRNIITVEDPVEYQLPGIGQMQVNTKIGLTFADGLRSILRQDPDVIMVGEIRDTETAQIAVQASLTGHLVFSTIHTNDSAGAVTRLFDMGVEPFLIASSLLAALAQRLVRVLCPQCKIEYRPESENLSKLGEEKIPETATFYRPAADTTCKSCKGSGYKGRTGIYELLPVDDDIRSMIVKNCDTSEIRRTAAKRGFTTMRQYGAKIVFNGTTSLEEVIRVTSDIS